VLPGSGNVRGYTAKRCSFPSPMNGRCSDTNVTTFRQKRGVQMQTIHRAAAVACSLILPHAISAHHSFAAHFRMDVFEEAEGRITDIEWTNPHTFIHIEDSFGESWEIELGPVNLLTRLGIQRGMLAVGESIRARGNPGRQNARSLWTSNILLSDRTELVVGPRAEPYWVGEVIGDTSVFVAEASAVAADDRSFFRIWTPPITAFPRPQGDPPLTARGREAQLAYGIDKQAIGDCENVGMPFAMMSPYPIELVDHGEDILIRSEYNDLERIVHKRELPSAPSPSPLGYSRARVEGSDLVIETDRIDFHSYGDQGPAQSGESHVTERFALSDDGREMSYEIVIDDPVMLSAPWRWAGRFVVRDDAELKPWNCGEEI